MRIVGNEHLHTHFDREQPPVLTVRPGEEVAFDTADACYGEVHSAEEFLEYRKGPARGGDPLTGPVYVEGADPGNTLTVDILKIELTGSGFQLIGPNRAIVRDEVPDWSCWTITPAGDCFELSNGMRFPVDPVIGTFGDAPAGERTDLPNPLGGNCDIPAARAGCRLHVPVEVPGALFSLGDVHACQGDGEVVGAPEVEARVAVRFGAFDVRVFGLERQEQGSYLNAHGAEDRGRKSAEGKRLALSPLQEVSSTKYQVTSEEDAGRSLRT